MDIVSARLQVFFEAPFWVGIFEQVIDGKLSVSKTTFGAEPKGYEVLEFILTQYNELRFSPAVDSVSVANRRMNPKRMQREVKKQITHAEIGTKSQQALKLQQEQGKVERKTRSRKEKEAEKQFQFDLRQQKRKERHKGR